RQGRLEIRCAGLELNGLRLAQSEETSLLVKWGSQFQASAVSGRHFDDALPVRRGNVRSGFENEPGGRPRPAKSESGIAACSAEAKACGGAGVQQVAPAWNVPSPLLNSTDTLPGLPK